MGENIDLIIAKAARQEIIDTIKDIEALDASFIEFAGHVAQFSKTKIAPKIPKEFNDSLKQATELTSKLEKSNKDLAGAEQKKETLLRRTIRSNNTNLQQLKSLNSVYNQYSRLLNDLRLKQKNLNTIKELDGKLSKQQTSELRKLNAEVKRYDSALKRVDAQSGQFQRNVGNYKSAFGGATVALSRFGAAIGIYSSYQIAEKIFSEVKQLETLNLALTAVTKSQIEFNQAQFFLDELAQFTGVNIIELTQSYIKFRGSLEGTNTTVKEAQRIYERITKASAILGASTEDVNGVLKALGQIMSKGKIQAEELRGQLGDRLAGAFGLMAKSLGITTAELDKMLERGELTSDMLGGLAEQIGETFGVDSVEKIDNIAAAQGRLSTAWTNFVSDVNGSKNILGNAFKSIIGFAGTFLDMMAEILKTDASKFTDELSRLKVDGFETATEELESKSKILNKTINEVARNEFFRYRTELDKSRDSMQLLVEEQKKLEGQTRIQGKRIVRTKEDEARLKEVNRLIEEESRQISFKEGKLEALTEATKKQVTVQEDLNDEIKDTTKSIQDLTPELDKLKGKSFSFGLFKDERKGAFDDIDPNDGSLFDIGNIEAPSTDEIEAALNRIIKKYEDVATASKLSAEQQADIFGELFSTFAGYYNIDLEAFKTVLFDKTAGVKDYANVAKEVSNFILGNTIQKYDAEIQANQDRLDTLLADESISDDVKKDAEKKQKEEEKRLKLKQAKAERTAILTQIAIDTAAAIIKVTAQTGVLAPFVIPSIIALGAAQAAFVASRPLPQFAEGTQNAPSGKAITDEEGAELHTDRHGNIKDWGSKKGARIKSLSYGDKIYTASQTEAIHRAIFMTNMQSQGSGDNLEVIFDKNLGKMRSEVSEGVREGLRGFKVNNKIINQVNQQRTKF